MRCEQALVGKTVRARGDGHGPGFRGGWARYLEDATAGAVTRSHVSNLKGGSIENPSLTKLEAMGFPPAL